jgi:ABC-type multidrug transport system fused ATPase/permease subunit
MQKLVETKIDPSLTKSKTSKNLFPFLVAVIFMTVVLFCVNLIIPNIHFVTKNTPTNAEANLQMILMQVLFTVLALIGILTTVFIRRGRYCIGCHYSAKEMKEIAKEIKLSQVDSTDQTEDLIARLESSTLQVKNLKALNKLLKRIRQSY